MPILAAAFSYILSCADTNPDIAALLDADIRPQDLDSAFATLCANDDVDFPAGTAECPDPNPAQKALEAFWKELRTQLPSNIDHDTTCVIQKNARLFRGQLRVSQTYIDRPAVVASLLDVWDCDSKIDQKWWAESASEKKRLRDLIQGLHENFRTSVVVPYLAQWRQYAYRLSVMLLSQAREFAAAERRRINALN
jgi:hypothetical protein